MAFLSEEYLIVGGIKFIDLKNLIRCYGYVSNSANISSMLLEDGTAYQVTVGKKFQLLAVRVNWAKINSNTAEYSFSIGYGNNSVGQASGSFPTTPVYMYGQGQGAGGPIPMASPVNDVFREVALLFNVPATKYPFVVAGTAEVNTTVVYYGYEVDP